MTLSPAWLDELRARTLLSSVIAPSVKLIRAGREFKACCPFHNEKTPSFTINDEKGFYHCFGCGAHGDAISFLVDNRGLPFMDAVKELAGKAGMDVPAPDPRARERSERAADLTDVMAACQRWFAEQLHGIDGAAARDYLAARGISGAQVTRFGIGLAPDNRGALKRALADLGEDKLVETGMLIRPEDGDRATYDRFRGRLMIPIRDQRGRVIAFGGRILGEGEPKYLNSPDTPLFDKGRTLYNIDRAGPASRQARRLIVVEGYMDVIGLDRAGIGEVVAPNGTAVTEAQLERMWRLEPAPILCFDGDAAGRKAAIRAATRALPHLGPERTLRFVELPAGQDPDDLVRSGGRQAVEDLLASPEPLDQRLWRHERDAQPLTTPEARAGLRQRLVEHAQSIGDPELRRLYRDQWLNQFNAEFGAVRYASPTGQRRPQNRFDKRTGRWLPPAPPASAAARRIGRGGIDTATARALVHGFALYPEALPAHVEQLAHLPIADKALSALRDRIVDAALAEPALDRQKLATILQAAGAAAALDQARQTGGIGFSFTRSDTAPDRAVRDLGIAIDALSAEEEIGAALDEATERLQAGEDTAFDEQQRLHGERERIMQRLASLAGTD
ncbi:DNA primase [Sphingomonas sabuli]|uniref:DNA primase n=1 Tax=Sphingomonas sabuli TaxID=2764186 RepID=A0A7G9L4N3_9SPHN|nr:DNA primase [Sphingomonas sabuli]QNM83582.1 DNA primase [Sphingomonas sabuli]